MKSRISGNFPSPNPAGLNLLETPFCEQLPLIPSPEASMGDRYGGPRIVPHVSFPFVDFTHSHLLTD